MWVTCAWKHHLTAQVLILTGQARASFDFLKKLPYLFKRCQASLKQKCPSVFSSHSCDPELLHLTYCRSQSSAYLSLLFSYLPCYTFSDILQDTWLGSFLASTTDTLFCSVLFLSFLVFQPLIFPDTSLPLPSPQDLISRTFCPFLIFPEGTMGIF
jgi:hypothetical protein